MHNVHMCMCIFTAFAQLLVVCQLHSFLDCETLCADTYILVISSWITAIRFTWAFLEEYLECTTGTECNSEDSSGGFWAGTGNITIVQAALVASPGPGPFQGVSYYFKVLYGIGTRLSCPAEVTCPTCSNGRGLFWIPSAKKFGQVESREELFLLCPPTVGIFSY